MRIPRSVTIKDFITQLCDKMGYDPSRFKVGHRYVHYKVEDQKVVETARNNAFDILISKV